jgi:hypothetical protein
MRAAKLASLRAAVNLAVGTGSTPSPLPVSPLIDIIAHYAIEDFTITTLIRTGEKCDADACSGLNARLKTPTAIAVVQSASNHARSEAASDEIMVIDHDYTLIRLYSPSAGTVIVFLALICCARSQFTDSFV